MLNFVFVFTMFAFILFSSIFITTTIFCVFNAVLERLTGIGLVDIWNYAISAVLDGLKAFFR